jgi:hypothetical protein
MSYYVPQHQFLQHLSVVSWTIRPSSDFYPRVVAMTIAFWCPALKYLRSDYFVGW